MPFLPCGPQSPLARAAESRFTPEFRPIPVSRNSCPWDCKNTPVYCTCQEGNTIGCITSNDSLGAAFRAHFPHEIQFQGLERLESSIWGPRRENSGPLIPETLNRK